VIGAPHEWVKIAESPRHAERRRILLPMHKAVAGLAVVAVMLSSCSQSNQAGSESNSRAANVTACHTLGEFWYHTNSPTLAQLNQMFADMDKAGNSRIRIAAKAAEYATKANDYLHFTKQMQIGADICHALGLLDLNGNPT
jgi:hypothetical protein